MLAQFKGKENEARKDLKVLGRAMLLKSARAKFWPVTKKCALSTSRCSQWESYGVTTFWLNKGKFWLEQNGQHCVIANVRGMTLAGQLLVELHLQKYTLLS